MITLEELQRQQYQKDNFRIEYSGDNHECVAIYFTSNNLFFPHNMETFQRSVIEKDRYEWTNIRIKRANKHIFVRDIYKQWYASGINERINTLEKLIDWLSTETANYKEIITVGSSGGGYAATIVGSRLKASLVFNFNGQWDIQGNIFRDGSVISPILKGIQDRKEEGSKFFNIANKEFDYKRIFYFVSTLSKWDSSQMRLVDQFKHIHRVRFANPHHGIPFLKNALPSILNMSYEELNKLANKKHIPIFFEIKYAGLISTCSLIAKRILNK